MAIRIQIRRDTSTNWTTVNPLLADGEMGVETNTRRLKIGNGFNNWNDLLYQAGGSSLGDYSADLITNAPAGSISATNVQAAIDELDAEKASTTDSRLSNTRTPTDASVTNAKVAAAAAIAESKLALASDAASNTPSRRTLGTGALQAPPGNDSRFHTRNHKLFSTDHTDVNEAGVPVDGDALIYSGALSKWIASPPPSGGGGGFEAGDTKTSMRATASPGWLLCNGTQVSRTTFSALFEALGGTDTAINLNGQGDGSTTFNLPDGRGRALIGAGAGAGLTNRAVGAKMGAETHTLTEAQLAAHTHTAYTSASATAENTATGGAGTRLVNLQNNATASGNAGSNQAHPNMSPSLAANLFIKT